MSKLNRKMILSFLAVVLLVGLVKLEIPGNTFLSREINNAMHFPFFGILSLTVFGLLSLYLNRMGRLQIYFSAFNITIVIGALHELSQVFGPRDADVADLIKDAAGAVTFLGFFMIYDKKMTPFWQKYGPALKSILFVTAVLLIISILAPIAIWAEAYIHRDNNFPVICDFESFWETRFLKTEDAVLEIEKISFVDNGADENKAGKLTFFPVEYPGLLIEEPYPDWTGYKSFDFSVYSDLEGTVPITVRIEDSWHDEEYSDRFNRTFDVAPGLNEISIPLNEVQRAPSTRNMDMKKIRAILLFAHNPDKEFALYFDDFHLE
jgi:hypothetical protein